MFRIDEFTSDHQSSSHVGFPYADRYIDAHADPHRNQDANSHPNQVQDPDADPHANPDNKSNWWRGRVYEDGNH